MSTLPKKLVVIGMDGSTWDLLTPLMEQGYLPTLQKLRDQGSSAVLDSTHPAHTAPAWTTFATGVQPTVHGCLDFLVVRDDIDNLDIIDSTFIKQETIYQTMARHYKKPILINLPNTFPPKLASPTVTSLMTRGSQYVFPESLLEKYPEWNEYPTSPDASLRVTDNLAPYMKHLVQLEEKRIELAKILFEQEEWDYFFFLSSATDWMSHVAYDKALANHPDAIEVWKVMDNFLAWILERLDANTNMIVMSDHGFKVYDNVFFINRWLEEEGYLTTTTGQGSFNQATSSFSKEMDSVRKKRKTIRLNTTTRKWLGKSKFIEKIAKKIYFKIVRRFLPITVTFDVKLDLLQTRVAFPRGSAATMLYVNDTGRFVKGLVNPKDRFTLADEIKTKLLALRDKAGNPYVGQVFTAQELYGTDSPAGTQSGSIEIQPDLFIEFGEYYVSGSLHSPSLTEKSLKNYHDQHGIFVAHGPDIAKRELEPSSIINLAPTMLHALGLPLQPQFTGEVLPIFTNDFPTPTVEVAVEQSKRDFSDIEGISI